MNIRIILGTVLIFALFLSLPADPAAATQAGSGKAEKEAKVAVIIDDFGGNTGGVYRFLRADIPITVAVMPFLEESTEQAEMAHELGFEVIVHLPLEPKNGKASWLGPMPITSELSDEEVKNRVEKAIEDVPYAKGLNNHMGSNIVGNRRIMKIILEVAREHDLYVIDSGTSPDSVIPELAEEMNLRWAVRDTFLDDSRSSRHHVYKQMIRLCSQAERNGEAIGIGHVGIKGTDTFNGISDALEHLKDRNIKIVPASELIPTRIEKEPGEFWQRVKGGNRSE
ncbi:divergent polysaccharide deacetylase family protein [Alteribacter natronophilus]|uniref:divergent polysaccharide deacetylase family protein n=1 Tax=Alteribacter natronophilus TaxID=2583810 RepID=UPI00110F2C61|nr:divergent polysaccharide deacetylase family protein [Alteribacter natronophilus]TMW73709.1 divergent polysaccharide deacetylase family protein [Alteribacter natronophilus]